VAGERYRYDDPRLAELVNQSAKVTQAKLVRPTIAMFLPFLKKIFPSLDEIKGVDNILYIKKFLLEAIEEHTKTFDPENIRDFIDAYIHEIKVC
jgi:hypothetical protein